MGTETVDFRKTLTFLQALKKVPSFIRLSAGTLFFNAIRLGFLPLVRSQRSRNQKPIKKIVIIGFGGIGNHLMLLPAIRMIGKEIPVANLHIVAATQACAELFKHEANVDGVSVFSFNPPRSRGLYRAMVRHLRGLKPDAIVAAAGLDPVSAGMISFLGRARLRIGANWRGRGFLFTHEVELNGDEYESTQNLRLAAALLGKHCIDSRYFQMIPQLQLEESLVLEGRRWKEFLKMGPDRFLVGLHPGSGIEQKWKRGDLRKFVELAECLEERSSCKCVFFLGPDEADIESDLKNLEWPWEAINIRFDSILQTASCIAQCQLFIANDSGLRQLAVALGVPSIGIFGPTGTGKNFIGSNIHHAVVADHVFCRPCHYTRWWLACEGDRRCLADISVDDIFENAQMLICKRGRDKRSTRC